MQQNDERIKKLMRQIDNRKKELRDEAPIPAPVTNCTLTLFGNTMNLRTLNEVELVILEQHLGSLISAFGNESELTTSKQLSGYSVLEWVEDINSLLRSKWRKERIKRLATMEKRLKDLLSEESRVENELNEIERFL